MAKLLATHRFVHTTPHSIDRVWRWFASPGAFYRLAAPWLPLRAEQQASDLGSGEATLAVAPFGVELPLPDWRARHDPTGYSAGTAFADAVVSEPYRAVTGWRHVHRFEPDGTSTRVVDEVTARVPRALLAPVFAYRAAQLDADLAAHDRFGGPRTIAITGASGLIGRQLAAFLATGGHRVIALARSASASSPYETRLWNVTAPDPAIFDDVDVVVHLAGEPILGRFDAAHKAAIRDSRVGPTHALATALARHGGPRALVAASAVGFYGTDRGDEPLTEDSPRGAGFLADVVERWEEAARPAAEAGVRTVQVRTAGMVLSGSGGALAALRPLFGAGLGGRLGDGRQWMSWIDLDDLLDVYLRAIATEIAGPINAVSPEPVRNADFTRALGQALRRPTLVPTPAFGPRLLLGDEGYAEMLLASHREVPARLLALGHPYRFGRLAASLAHQLGRPQPR